MHRRSVLVLIGLVGAVLAAIPPQAALAGSGGTSSGTTSGDFDGDGFDDLAVGIQGEDRGPNEALIGETGAVNVFYGGANGLSAAGNELLLQSNFKDEELESGDSFGRRVAAGDLNGDGFDDLAVSAPFEDLGTGPIGDAGAVFVFYGSPGGLKNDGSQRWTQNSAGVGDKAESGDFFGNALAIGNFGRGSAADLAIGVTNEDLGTDETPIPDAGLVTILYGTNDGLKSGNSFTFHQGTQGIASSPVNGERFGHSLAVGDVGKSSQRDLVIGIPGETLGGEHGVGAAAIVFGSEDGLGINGDQFWHRSKEGIQGTPAPGDAFGWTVTVGNFGKSDERDVAIAAPGANADSIDSPGVVQVLYSGPNGPTAQGDQMWHENIGGIAGTPDPFEGFGNTILAANVGKSAHADLIVGMPYSSYGDDTFAHEGVAHVIYGTDDGLKPGGDQLWSQDVDGIADAPEHDHFGQSLAAGDFGKGGVGDVAIGSPLEGVPGASENQAGAVHALYGRSDGLASTGAQFWHQDVEGIKETADESDRFADSYDFD